MIHECPMCRHHPLGIELEEERHWYCPECGWKEEIPKDTVMKIV